MSTDELLKMWESEYDYDPIKEGVKEHGYIKTMTKGDRYYGEYKEFSRSVKSKYFRKNGLPIDQFADYIHMDINELLEKLWA